MSFFMKEEAARLCCVVISKTCPAYNSAQQPGLRAILSHLVLTLYQWYCSTESTCKYF